MKIRSITLFSPTLPRDESALAPLARLGEAAHSALVGAGYDVQTVRLATPPWPRFFGDTDEALGVARWLDKAAPEVGIGYVSIGPVEAAHGAHDGLITATTVLLEATEKLFCSVLLADAARGVNVRAVNATARAILANSSLEPNGFGNLRFAALANVGPGSPFFPAAYSDPASTAAADAPICLALALESADLAVEAYRRARSLNEAMG
ncbi:MAG: DUF711 family protein, partial [Ardenticatenaceae bacterium]